MASDGGAALVIACGALARELAALRALNGWSDLAVRCLPAELHNRPERIAAAVRAAIAQARGRYAQIFVAYADCGTAGTLDAVLAEERVARLAGAHCYEVLAGAGPFAALAEAEPGTFYLTDFLARHFDRLVIGTLGIDRHPELAQTYFAHYRRLVYLRQTDEPGAAAELRERARRAAERLGLAFDERRTGVEELGRALSHWLPLQARPRAARPGAPLRSEPLACPS
jgi:hypothetical protein